MCETHEQNWMYVGRRCSVHYCTALTINLSNPGHPQKKGRKRKEWHQEDARRRSINKYHVKK